MKELFEIPVKDFVAEIAGATASPGGGSVAALCGALAAALVSMSAKITIENKYHLRHEDLLKEVLTELDQIKSELETSVQREAESFQAITDAHSMASYPESARKKKLEATEQALKGATLIPLEIMTLCSKGLKLSQKILGKTTPLTISEIGGSVIAFNAAIKSAALIVLTNLQTIEDQSFVQDYKEKSQELLGIGENLYREIHSHCIKVILGHDNSYRAY